MIMAKMTVEMKNIKLLALSVITDVLLNVGFARAADKFDPLGSVNRGKAKRPIPVSKVCIPCDLSRSRMC